MQREKVPNLYRKEVEIYRFFFIPIALLLGIVPLITRLQLIQADTATQEILKSEQISDFFSQYKAYAIILLGGIMLVLLMLSMGWEEIKKGKSMFIFYTCLAVYLIVTGISTLYAKQRTIAIWGIADRAEGMVIILCYGIILFYTIYMVNKEDDYKYMVIPLIFLTLITGIIGFFQYIGYDLLTMTKLGRALIVPKEYTLAGGSISSTYASKRIQGTMYHYNYMGSFTAMMIPFFGVLMIFAKTYKKRIILGITFFVSVFLLFGSTSRAGIIGVIGSILMLMIIFSNRVFRNLKEVGKGIVILTLFILILNGLTKGAIFERVPTLINDMKAIIGVTDNDFDYKESLPIRNIKTIGNSIELELQDSKLIIEADLYNIYFKDETGKSLAFERTEEGYQLSDDRYQGLMIKNERIVDGETRDYVVIQYDHLILWRVEVNTEEGARLVDINTCKPITLDEPETFGFKGKEKLGSARGYIWSRSIPMLKDTIWKGYGPDQYPFYFPQNDFFGKWYAYDTPHMVVDKPHNLYLQIALNQGCIALVAFLVAVLLYIVQSMKLYTRKMDYTLKEIMGCACMGAVVGYLGAGVFNDSVVSVAPIFWVIWGFGIATNYLCKEERKAYKES